MKQNKLFLGLATLFAIAFTFTACSSDDAESRKVEQTGQKINFVYGPGGTRTVTDPQSGTSVATNLNVGIFGVSSEASTTTMTNYTNTKYVTASGNALNYAGDTDKEMTWPTAANATASIYAYAPYQEDWTVDAANTFTVGADQSDDTKYLASDLLYASATNQANGSTVALAFGHKLAKVNVTITKATGSTVNLANATVSITGTKRVAKFTPSTGVVAVDGTASASDILALTIGSDLTAGDANSKATACAVVVPQDLAAETAFVKIVTSDSKTLIGKLSSAATLESNGTYSMNISVGNVTEAETIVKVSFGKTSLVEWGADTPIGLTAYGVGDYVLTDGTFMKKTAYATASSADQAKVAGIIFSTTVSSTDAAAGYNAYAVGVRPYANRTWNSVSTGDYQSTNVTTATTTLSAGIDDLDGKTKTAELMEKYYPSLTDTYKSSFVANLTGYSIALTGSNLSSWFLPSFGQMVLILNELGGTTITKTFIDGGDNISSGSAFYTNGTTTEVGTTNPNLETLVSNLNTSFSVGGGSQFSTSDVNFSVSTENGGEGHKNKIWLVQFENSTWKLTKGGNRNGNGKSVLPCIAIKNLPTVAE